MPHVRDRLEEFQRQANKNELSSKNEKKKEEIKIDLDECETIRTWIDSINEKTAKAEEILKNSKLHSSKDLQNELKTLFKNSESIIFKVSEKLKQMRVTKAEVEAEGSTVIRMKYLQYTSLQQYFRESMENHREIIERHRKNLKMLALKTHRTIHGDVHINDEELERLIDDQKQCFTDDVLVEIREAQLQLRDIEQRHKELLIIEEHLTEVKDLFVQIAILVEQQQEDINRAEHHAALSTNAVEQARIDLGKANKKRKKTNKTKIIIITSLIILALLIVLAIIFN